MLEELITRNDCAKCKICCKFEKDELIDAPMFNKQQVNYIRKNISNKIKFTYHNGAYQINLIKYKNKYKCPLLSPKGCVLPNIYRPFDCESWPFYIMAKNNKFVITKSNVCPIFNNISNDILIEFIEKKFLNIAKEIVINSPELITKYNRNLEVLYEFTVSK